MFRGSRFKVDKAVKSPKTVMPAPSLIRDPGWRIRYPDLIEITEFRLSPEWHTERISDSLRGHQG